MKLRKIRKKEIGMKLMEIQRMKYQTVIISAKIYFTNLNVTFDEIMSCLEIIKR